MSILDDEDDVMNNLGKSIFEKLIEDIQLNVPDVQKGYDAFGRPVNIGDYVIYSEGSYPSKRMVAAKVIRFTPKKTEVEFTRMIHDWSSGGIKKDHTKFLIHNSQLVKIDNPTEFLCHYKFTPKN